MTTSNNYISGSKKKKKHQLKKIYIIGSKVLPALSKFEQTSGVISDQRLDIMIRIVKSKIFIGVNIFKLFKYDNTLKKTRDSSC